MDFGPNLADGFQHILDDHLADLAFVGAGLVFHDSDTVLLVAGEPGLDGAPGELARVAVLIGEGHLADSLDAAWMELPGAMSMAPSTRIFR